MFNKKRKRKSSVPGIPVNSFSDIAFLLIVFFVVASSLTKTRGVISDFPSGEISDVKQDKTTVVQLTANRMTLDDSEVGIEELRRKLAEMRLHDQDDDARIILLEATEDVNYQLYYSAMTAISGAGGFVAVVKEGGEE